jgi:hypothetical protein
LSLKNKHNQAQLDVDAATNLNVIETSKCTHRG